MTTKKKKKEKHTHTRTCHLSIPTVHYVGRQVNVADSVCFLFHFIIFIFFPFIIAISFWNPFEDGIIVIIIIITTDRHCSGRQMSCAYCTYNNNNTLSKNSHGITMYSIYPYPLYKPQCIRLILSTSSFVAVHRNA